MRRRRQRGALLVDAMVGIFMMVVATLAFLSLFPTIHRAQAISSEESKAAKIASRVVEHLQMLPRRDLNATALSQLNLIDSGQTASPYSFTDMPLDDASNYSVSEALPSGEGTLTITDISHDCTKVVVDITWTSAAGTARSYRTGTILGNFR